MTTTASHEERMLVDGKLVESETGRTFDNINPATEEVIGQVADGTGADMHRAIDGARRAFDETDWSTNRELRKRCLSQLQEALEKDREELREELILEVGCPRMTTHANQLDIPLDGALRYPVKLIDEFPWRTDLSEIVDRRGTANTRQIWKERIGVVGAIVPWNFPIEVTLNKLGQALATGNTVILKPAPDTPWNATRIGRLVAERTDFPDGVFQVVPTTDNGVAEDLVTDPRVDLISFTGSTAVGRRIMEKGAPTLKRLFLELGGKSADVVLEDADLAAKLSSAWTVCIHGGQGCVMLTRLLLPRSRYEEGIELMTEGFEKVPYGDPTDPSNFQGPQINGSQRDKILRYIETARDEGARIVTGGKRPAHLEKGYYVEPTLIADVDNSMTVAKEEIFGPVLVVIPFEDDDDAVRIANESNYGLGCGVTSGSEERAISMARRIRAGTAE